MSGKDWWNRNVFSCRRKEERDGPDWQWGYSHHIAWFSSSSRTRPIGIHTHPFNGPLSGTTWMNRYQKGKTNLDFTEARDNEWQWHQLGRMQVCTSLQTDNHASTPPLSFLQAGCLSCRPTSGKSGPKDQVALHYYYTSPSHWCTTHEVSKL